MYSDKLLDRFYEPTHVGSLDHPARMGHRGNPSCGDVVEIYLESKDGKITNARFRALGCAVTIAAADAICEAVSGASEIEATYLDIAKIVSDLGGVPDSRLPCVEAPLSALRAALTGITTDRA